MIIISYNVFFFVAYILFSSVAHTQSIGYPPQRFLSKKYALIHGRRMAYVDVGKGDPIVFFHDNPSSSYVWRNVMPHLERYGRLIAPDLIGMGDSEKLPPTDPTRYSLEQHMNYLYALLEHIGVKERVTLVTFSWGTIFGAQWAYLKRRDPNAVKGIVVMEPVFTDVNEVTNDTSVVGFWRTPAGQKSILQQNIYIDRTFEFWMIRKLSKREKDEWRRPFRVRGESRRALAYFPTQLLLNGMPESSFTLFAKLRQWFAESEVKKLVIKPQPGFVTRSIIEEMRSWPNVEEVSCKGIFYAQEDDPHVIGKSIAKWIDSL